MTQLTPSQYIKSKGLPSTKYVAEAVNKPAQTLNNWHRDNFALFEVVVAGVKALDADKAMLDAIIYGTGMTHGTVHIPFKDIMTIHERDE